MSGILSPINVGKLIIGDTYAAAADVTALAALAAKNIQIFSANGSAPAAGVPFKLFGVDNSSTGVAISDKIDPNSIKSVKAFAHVAETATIKVVNGFTGTVRDNATYKVAIRKYDGLQSPENFRDINAYAVTGPSTAKTWADIIAELVAGLETSLKLENNSKEFTITSGADSITVTGLVQPYVQGKDSGEPVDFDLIVSVADTAGNLYSDLSVAVTEIGNSGQGTGKQISIMEYFFNGYETTDYGREVSYPHNFAQNFLADGTKTYNTVVIEFFHDRNRVNIERSPKMLFVAVEFTDLASNAVTNALLADIRTITGLTTGQLPDFAVV